MDATPPAAARLLSVITVLLVLGALKWSSPVTMPLAFALFIIIVVWPIRRWTGRWLPQPASVTVTLLVLLLVLAVFAAGIYYSGRQIAEMMTGSDGRLQSVWQSLRDTVRGLGLDLPEPRQAFSRLAQVLPAVVTGVWGTLGLIALILSLVALGLPAVDGFRQRMLTGLERDHTRAITGTVREVATKVQKYLAAVSIGCILTGLLTTGFAWLVGLDFAILWGIIAFLLNYIPTIGSVIAVIPPTLFALVQFDGWALPLVVWLGLSVIQLVMGTIVTPRLEGRFMKLSPVVVLFSLMLWGWIWGIPGALLAAPLTMTFIIACGQFPATRWIAALLSEPREGTRNRE